MTQLLDTREDELDICLIRRGASLLQSRWVLGDLLATLKLDFDVDFGRCSIRKAQQSKFHSVR